MHNKILCLTLSTVFLTSCYINKPIVSTNADNNETYTVDYLFEHDGCKVYRFTDKGRDVYFTNCTGNITVASNDSTGTYLQNLISRSDK